MQKNVILDVKKIIWLVKVIDMRKALAFPQIITIECDNKNFNIIPRKQRGRNDSTGEQSRQVHGVQ